MALLYAFWDNWQQCPQQQPQSSGGGSGTAATLQPAAAAAPPPPPLVSEDLDGEVVVSTSIVAAAAAAKPYVSTISTECAARAESPSAAAAVPASGADPAEGAAAVGEGGTAGSHYHRGDHLRSDHHAAGDDAMDGAATSHHPLASGGAGGTADPHTVVMKERPHPPVYDDDEDNGVNGGDAATSPVGVVRFLPDVAPSDAGEDVAPPSEERGKFGLAALASVATAELASTGVGGTAPNNLPRSASPAAAAENAMIPMMNGTYIMPMIHSGANAATMTGGGAAHPMSGGQQMMTVVQIPYGGSSSDSRNCNGEQLSVMCTNGNSDDSGGGEQISVMCMMVPMWFPHGSSSYVASDSAAAGVPVLKKLKTDGGSAATADADASETDAEAQAIASDFVDYLNEVFRDSAPCATIAHSALHASFEAPSSTISSVYATAV